MEKTIEDVLVHLQEWRRYPMVVGLLLFETLVFFWSGWGYWSWGVISASRLDSMGALNTRLVDQGEFWRLLSSIFLHAGWFHWVINSLNLYVLGVLVQRLYGSLWMMAAFVLARLSGSILTWGMATPRTVGASGAIFGWMGMLVVLGWKYRRELQGDGGNMLRQTMPIWTVVSLLLGWLVPMIDNAAHIGGLSIGMALGLLVEPKSPKR